MQLVLLNYCVKYSNIKQSISIFDVNNFWEYPYFIDYIYITGSFIFILCAVSNIITFNNVVYTEFLGLLSASIEACLGIPQIIQNYKSKSTKSLSFVLVGTWVFGDLFKTFYFLKTNAPVQLICCGLVQIMADFLVIFQIVYYTQEKFIYRSIKQNDEDTRIAPNLQKF